MERRELSNSKKIKLLDVKYLNEENLGKFIHANITSTFLHDKPIPGSNSRKRFDYILLDHKAVVEFDGDSHYTSAKAIVNDSKKEQLALSMGYNTIRIPYFIQLDDTMIDFYFGKYLKADITKFDFNSYAHGFIDKRARLPGDFCELGQKRFLEVWQSLPQLIKLQLGANLRDIITLHTQEVAVFKAVVDYLAILNL